MALGRRPVTHRGPDVAAMWPLSGNHKVIVAGSGPADDHGGAGPPVVEQDNPIERLRSTMGRIA
ncbi:hypothetical protein [Alloactinosynnema sp. L-07]|nr:hypothetical protein [Alloactinosynnema sp. L-07]